VQDEALSVWLDDRRPPPHGGWTWAKTPAETIALLESGRVEPLSLDHGLGIFEDDRELTGNDVLVWIEEAVVVRGIQPPASIAVHPAHPRARSN